MFRLVIVSFRNILFVSVSEFMYISEVCTEAKIGHWICWSQSYRWLQVVGCGIWVQKLDPWEDQQLILTYESHLQPY